jgi:hypothetical protein
MKHKPLNEIASCEFAHAKRSFRASTVLQWAIAAVATGVITNAFSNTPFVVLSAFLLPIGAFLCKEVGAHFHAKGERVRGMLMLQQGLGLEPSEAELLEVLAGESGAVPSEPKPIGGYYSSEAAAGFPRLLHQLQESAFWTAALAWRTAVIHYAIAGAGVVCALVVAVIALRPGTQATSGSVIDFSRLFSTLLVFFLASSTMTSARSYHSLSRAAAKAAARAAELRKRGGADPIELYKVMAPYDSALAKVPPLPSYVYKSMQKKLQTAWDAVQARAAGSQA